MVKKIKEVSCCGNEMPIGCCKVEALVNVDERGQMVLPKEVRERAGIKANDKLALMSWEKEGKICLSV
jgi:AbrB family looped-hinge helix DNA binding protein